jgi:serine/threonine-protein kinase
VPREILREARPRVQRIAIATTAMIGTVGVGWLVMALFHWITWSTARTLPVMALAGTSASACLYVLSRSKRISDTTVVFMGLGFVVALSGLGGFAHAVHELQMYGLVTAFGPYTLALSMFPLLFPCPPRWALVTALLASASVLIGMVAGAHVESASIPRAALLDVLVVLLGCAMLAYVGSRMIFRLQADVAKALRLGSYELEEKLGQGGMGEVWRARHRMLARRAAIKLIQPRHLDSEEARQQAIDRFSREARTTAALESVHTVRLYDFGVTDEHTFYYAMELLDGLNLDELVLRHGPQPPERVLAILLQVCDSLAEAHEMGLVHRDIKPANIMLCRLGRSHDVVKVLDFGIVSLQPEMMKPGEEQLTGAGSLVGTPAFMSPEALLGDRCDQRSDLYSLGCVAYWLLTGRLVFNHPNPVRLIAAHLRDEVEPPSAAGVTVPAELEGVVLACLAKKPEARPQRAEDLAAMLAACPIAAKWDNAAATAWWKEQREKPTVTVPVPAQPSSRDAATRDSDAPTAAEPHPTVDQRGANRNR